jgi:hypothetical protein
MAWQAFGRGETEEDEEELGANVAVKVSCWGGAINIIAS